MRQKRHRLFIGQKCHCGSRLWHQFDYYSGGHYSACERRQHRAYVDKPWAPTLFDFFCECGGVFVAIMHSFALSSGVEIMRDFVCPACATRWRFMCPPEDKEGATDHPAMALALLNHSDIMEILRDNDSAFQCAMALREYSNRHQTSPGLENFFRNLFSRFKEVRVPPDDMPEKVAFLAWVAEIKPRFESRFEEEMATGLLVWCRDG